VIQLTGYHYHNADQLNQSEKFVRDSFLKTLEEGSVKLPDGYDEKNKKLTGELVDVPFKDLGITRAWVRASKPIVDEWIDPDALLAAESGTNVRTLTPQEMQAPIASPENGGAPEQPKSRAFKVRRCDFVVQFCWQPTTRTKRRQMVEERKAADAAKAAEAAAAGGAPAEPAGGAQPAAAPAGPGAATPPTAAATPPAAEAPAAPGGQTPTATESAVPASGTAAPATPEAAGVGAAAPAAGPPGGAPATGAGGATPAPAAGAGETSPAAGGPAAPAAAGGAKAPAGQ
jgi:hypothetical protein